MRPAYYNPDSIGEHRVPDLGTARTAGLEAGLTLASKDEKKRIVVGIDLQDDFIRDDGSLKVEGALGDLRRFINYLYDTADTISALLFSLDQHLPWQIFYSMWWKDKNGKHPAPYTMISEDDVKNGVWYPQLEKKWSLEYPARLAATGQSPLIIWPEHCMIGTEGAALMADLCEAIEFLAAARGIQPMYMFKGTVPKSEHYGPFCCCVPVDNHPQGGLQTQFMDMIATYDVIDVAGQAEDFCVRTGVDQLLNYYGSQPDVIGKIRFLKDCTSLVFPDKRTEADDVLEAYAAKGVQIVTTDSIEAVDFAAV